MALRAAAALLLCGQSAASAVDFLQQERTAGCRPVAVQQGFDLAAYAAKPWYVQQQAATRYLPQEQNFCVSAEYAVLEKPTLWGYTVRVHNVAQEADGTLHDSGSILCARGTDPGEPAKLEVGPCFLPRIPGVSTGPYWVLAYDEEKGYALISGGQPTIEAPGGCRTGSGVNSAGLWIFTRQRRRDDALVSKVRGLAQAQGFDLGVLADVAQDSCEPHAQTAPDQFRI